MGVEWADMGNMRITLSRCVGIGLCGAVLGVFQGGFPCRALADAATDARRAIQTAYDRMDAATDRKDVRGATASYAPIFVEREPKGTEDRAQKAETARDLFASSQSLQAGSTIQSVDRRGRQATVVVRRRLSYQSADADAGSGRRDSWVLDVTEQDTWVRGRGGWRWTASQRLSSTETENGQPFRPHHGRRPAMGQ